MKRSSLLNQVHLVILCLILGWVAPSKVHAATLQPAKLFANLPENCPTPDAFAVAPNGSLTLSCPNFANNKLQGELLSIQPNGQVKHLATVPTLEFKTKANPMGIAYDNEGALYVADARGIKNGRVLKLTFDNDKLIRTEVIAKGINPNGLRYHNGSVYVTQLKLPRVKTKHMTSAIYRFAASSRNLAMTNTLQDKEIVFSTETKNPDIQFGLDGLDFNSKGHLFTANLGDGDIYELTIDTNGKLLEKRIVAKLPANARIDGIVFDKYDNLYLAGFGLNQIFKLQPNGALSLLADYPDNDGSAGQIDQPADLMIYQDKLVISNFDLMSGPGIKNSGHNKPYTISYIKLNQS